MLPRDGHCSTMDRSKTKAYSRPGMQEAGMHEPNTNENIEVSAINPLYKTEHAVYYVLYEKQKTEKKKETAIISR